MAGVSAETDQSGVSAAAVPAQARTAAVSTVDQRAGACSSPMPLRRKPGSVRTNTVSSTPAQTSESASACTAAGAWYSWAKDGIAIVAAASRVSIDTVLAL